MQLLVRYDPKLQGVRLEGPDATLFYGDVAPAQLAVLEILEGYTMEVHPVDREYSRIIQDFDDQDWEQLLSLPHKKLKK